MAFAPRFLLYLVLTAACFAHGQESVRFRQWIAGQEAGGAIQKHFLDASGEHSENLEWTRMERQGTVIEQRLQETALRGVDGGMTFTWTLSLSQEPMEGRATWSPAAPRTLRVSFKDGPAREVALPADVVLWPEDEEALLKAAARQRKPLKMSGYSLPSQQFTALELEPAGPDPLPGFPDAIHFRGKASEGSLTTEMEVWVSPVHGRIRDRSSLGGITLLSQRVELPPPEAGSETGLFERTLKTLPPHPFLLWLDEAKVRWNGPGAQALPEDAQQRRTGPNRYRLARAAAPAGPAALEAPVRGKPTAEDAPYLAATPLVQFNDPVFAGLMERLHPRPGAGRWELARQVTDFVYDWIKDKNYAVGFASAQEVARNGRGDCTEHGVLAVALLRRLGVPARGVTGWVAFGEVLGLHFWVEAKIGGAWVPLDPTFDQAPASAYRIKLGATDLADLGSVGWDNAAASFTDGSWVPDGPWAREVRPQGDSLQVAGNLRLRVPQARWNDAQGRLDLLWEGSHGVAAAPRPAPAQVATAMRLQGARTGLSGWWSRSERRLYIDLGAGRWLAVADLDEGQANRLLDLLEAGQQPVAKAA